MWQIKMSGPDDGKKWNWKAKLFQDMFQFDEEYNTVNGMVKHETELWILS